jgi:cytochrome c peroxidase
MNVGHHKALFWDGRAPTLEQQVLQPLVDPREHGFANIDQALSILRADPDYQVGFAKAFPKDKQAIQAPNLATALSAFVKSLVSAQSAIDRYVLLNDTKALSAEAQAGYLVFRGRAGCVGCHMLSDDAGTGRVQLTDQKFHQHGAHFYGQEDRMQKLAKDLLKSGTPLSDLRKDRMAELGVLGRFLVSGQISDVGAFKTPTLRNISKTGPYFHDGSVASLETAVDRELLIPGSEIRISPEDKRLLMVFLRALDDDPK